MTSAMQSFTYPIRLEPDREAGGFVVRVRDFGATQGDDEAHALRQAADFIGSWIDMMIEDGRPVPAPSAAEPGEVLVAAPLDAAIMAALHNAMLARGISKSELARRLGKDEKEVRRLLNPRHGSKLSSFRAAFDAIGLRLSLLAA